MNKPFRVCLFIGLILNVLLFTYMTISIIIGLVSAVDLVTNPDSLGEAFAAIAVVITIMLMIIILIITALGILFSSLCFNRVRMDPDKFSKKNKMLKTIIVYNVLVILFSIYSLIQTLDLMTIISLVGFIASSILIIIDMKKNKKLLQTAPLNNTNQINTPNETNNTNQINTPNETNNTNQINTPNETNNTNQINTPNETNNTNISEEINEASK